MTSGELKEGCLYRGIKGLPRRIISIPDRLKDGRPFQVKYETLGKLHRPRLVYAGNFAKWAKSEITD